MDGEFLPPFKQAGEVYDAIKLAQLIVQRENEAAELQL